ncbi:MAG: universal stress protein [Flavobacteriales bacterium]|nr:universal stress protein [Flavobacteriales bacterium]
MKNILVPLDLKAGTEKVLAMAGSMAKCTGAKLWLLHVAAPQPDLVGYEVGPQYIRDVRADELREEHSRLQRFAADLTEQGSSAQALLIMGPTVEVIMNEADRLNVDLLVMGNHGRHGLAKAFIGSVSDEVIHSDARPVLVVPTPKVA